MIPLLHDLLPLAPLVLPVMFLAVCLVPRARRLLPLALGILPLPGAAAALLGDGTGPLALAWLPWQPVFAIDRPGALLLGTAALLWSAAGFCVPAFFRGRPVSRVFCIFWVLTLIGSLGIFVAADLAAFLMCYVLVSLPAYALIIADESPAARRAGSVYLAFALLGEALLLMGLVMLTLSAPEAGPGIRELVAAMESRGTWGNLTLALLVAAFGMKIALVPFHFWMPLTYAAAPIPVAAVLSGAAVKAGIIGLIRFIPWSEAAPVLGQVLVVVGFTGAFFGVLVGVTQRDPKAVLAYSSISQMGFLAAVFGMGVLEAVGEIGTMTAFYAAQHVLVKGALFLAVGAAAWQIPFRKSLILLPAAIAGLGLAGLPLSGGSLAKEAVKGAMGGGWPGALSVLSAVGSAFLMWHFLGRLMQSTKERQATKQDTVVVAAWLVLAAGSIVIPWLLFAPSDLGSPFGTLALSALWSNLWPVLAGGALAWLWNSALRCGPAIPAGDIAAFGEPLQRTALAGAECTVSLDRWLRQWTVACLVLLLLIGALVVGALPW
jgi:formate hydrogenlyase subunit 3/multisubunit Na+/H+ antiporter MnhD subunit